MLGPFLRRSRFSVAHPLSIVCDEQSELLRATAEPSGEVLTSPPRRVLSVAQILDSPEICGAGGKSKSVLDGPSGGQPEDAMCAC